MTPGELSPYPLDSDWVDPRAGLDSIEKRRFLPCRELNLDRLVPYPSLCVIPIYVNIHVVGIKIRRVKIK
jgi:hypothetical protein